MRCKVCGAENRDGMSFCKECGNPLNGTSKATDSQDFNRGEPPIPPTGGYHSGPSGDYDSVPPRRERSYEPIRPKSEFHSAPRDSYDDVSRIPEEYKPITMWGYFGYELLFSIPLVGFILILVFSFGGTQNKNVRNFSRSYFCFIIVQLVLAFIFVGVFSSIISNMLYYF